MMIGLLTFHYAHNYGAVLQAYALQKTLFSLGFDNEFVDYRCQAITDSEKKRINPFVQNMTNTMTFSQKLKMVIYNCYAYTGYTKRWKGMERFIRNRLRASKHQANQCNRVSEQYSAFVCGSDQIWNHHITNGFDEYYFCRRPEMQKTVNIAYAASCGKSNIDASRDEIKCLLSSFDRISVREASFAKELGNMLEQEINVVLDPSLLLKDKDWALIEDAVDYKNPYVLLYLIEENTAIVEHARMIAAQRGLSIIEITSQKHLHRTGIRQLDGCSPEQFVYLLHHAEVVITNSFHGLCFSVIFHRDVYVVPHTLVGQRMIDLMKQIGLEERIVLEELNLDAKIDFVQAQKAIDELAQRSINFLQEALVNSQG